MAPKKAAATKAAAKKKTIEPVAAVEVPPVPAEPVLAAADNLGTVEIEDSDMESDSESDSESNLEETVASGTSGSTAAAVSSTGSSTTGSAHDNLYNSLSYNLPEEDLSNENKSELVTLASRLDVERREIIYHLCLIDFAKYHPNTKVVFPYKCKQLANDVLEIKVDSMPTRLKQIVYKFVKLAELSMQQH